MTKLIEYLKKEQAVFFQTIYNSFSYNKVPHSFLIESYRGLPLLESAKYIAKSLICNSKPACDNCVDCQRIDNYSYYDFIVLDGTKESVKKEDISYLQSRFSKNALESRGIKIYIIHLAENMTNSATNALLKFLEEPCNNVFAILTTNDKTKLLETITSRCMSLKLRDMSYNYLYAAVSEEGVPSDDSSILCKMYLDLSSVLNEYNNEYYQTFKKIAIETINNIAFNNEDSAYFNHQLLKDYINDAEKLLLYLNILEIILFEIYIHQYSRSSKVVMMNPPLDSCYLKIEDASTKIKEVILAKRSIKMFMSKNLIIDNLLINLKRNRGDK